VGGKSLKRKKRKPKENKTEIRAEKGLRKGKEKK
jgi:hypothetical protein